MRYPKLVRCAKTPVHVTIAAEEINAFGERETILDGDFLCNWQDKSQVKYTRRTPLSRYPAVPTLTGIFSRQRGISQEVR